MGEFFKGWRRKFGVVTLLLACLIMAGWVRSLRKVDFVIFYGYWPNHAFLSGSGHFRLFKLGQYTFAAGETDDGKGLKITYTFHKWSALFASHEWPPVFTYGALETNARPFDVFEAYDDSTGTPNRMWLIPYWSLIAPLTLLSAYLFLSKPRKSTQKKIHEPIPAEGK